MQDVQRFKPPHSATTVAIVDAQWGDTGKGKFVDLLSGWADIIARGTGGANAGHTICIGDETHIFHLIPSGILRDGEGKINIIGNGVAVDPSIIRRELRVLREKGLTNERLMIAYNAHLVLPQHLVMDRIRESSAGSDKIGTTGKGIGPLYIDHVARIGLQVADMLNKDCFVRKLKRNLVDKVAYLRTFDSEIVRKVMSHDDLANGEFYNPDSIFTLEAIVAAYEDHAHALRGMIRDTDAFLRKSVGTKKILLEGAQGVLLSVDHGIQPYVTSSDCTLAGLTKGVGLTVRDVDCTYSIVKAFFMTRVGEGVFPTEFGGEDSAKWCGSKEATKVAEQEKYPNASINSTDTFEQGVAIRLQGAEYGSTTERPRRTGWLDLPLLRYAMQFSSKGLILTKLDVLDECEAIRICVAYKYLGKRYDMGEKIIEHGDEIRVAIPNNDVLKYGQPVYRDFPGWLCKISDIRSATDLPSKLVAIVAFLEAETGAKVVAVSVGRSREQTIAL